jgi:hypothetical protein
MILQASATVRVADAAIRTEAKEVETRAGARERDKYNESDRNRDRTVERDRDSDRQ